LTFLVTMPYKWVLGEKNIGFIFAYTYPLTTIFKRTLSLEFLQHHVKQFLDCTQKSLETFLPPYIHPYTHHPPAKPKHNFF
jgi:hypothetical protein